MVGAEIYATVGREDKIQYPIDNFGIPANRIFNSRDESFLGGVLQETNERGVDLVLSSLAGDLLHATWSCVAPIRKMVEFGKGDLQGFGKLDMSSFLLNRSYCCVELDAFIDVMPEMVNR